ncbi:MAG: hypothetical protein MJ153_07960 [Clostridia bacterium]|nr:hypothetical protein [Clostridia bacterium]
MIKAVFIDFYGTVVYEDGEIVNKISNLIFETGNAKSVSEVDSYWWNSFRTLFENSYGEKFQTQRALEEEALADTIDYFKSSENAELLSSEMFDFWMKPTIFEETKQFFKECPVPIYIVSNIDRADILEAIKYHDLHPRVVMLKERMQLG